MITPITLLKHFYAVAPFVLDDFATKETPLDAIIDAQKNVVLTVADGAAYRVGGAYTVRGYMSNPFTSVANGFFHDITTSQPHNLTKPVFSADQKTCRIGNAECEIKAAPDGFNATVRGDVSGGVLYEPLTTEGVNCECLSVVGNVVTLRVGQGYVYPCDLVDCEVVLRQNVIVTQTAARAVSVYTSQFSDKLCAFIVMGDRSTIADRKSLAGVTAKGEQSSDDEYFVTTEFVFYVFWPKAAAESQRVQVEDAYGRIYESLNRIFFGLTNGNRKSQVTPTASGYAGSVADGAHYCHQYSFQVLDHIGRVADGVNDDWLHYNEAVRHVGVDLYVDTSFEADTQQRMEAGFENEELVN